MQESLESQAHLLSGVSTRISCDTDAMVLDARGVARHVRLEAAVDEHRNFVQDTLVEGVDAAVSHGHVGMLQHLELGDPRKQVNPSR